MKCFVRAPAKVNLFLYITGHLPGGFHSLEMLMERVDLCDEITLETQKENIEFVVADQNTSMGNPEKNLAYLAAINFMKEFKINSGVKITLKKNIPVAAGLGGGSSDAAAVLRGLNELFETKATPVQLSNIGAKLGSDVPFFCYETPGLVSGRGEVFEKTRVSQLPILIVNPNFPLCTKDVYHKYDEMNEGPLGKKITSSKNIGLTGKRAGVSVPSGLLTLEDSIELLHNDLETAAVSLHPAIDEVRKNIDEAGASGVLMSGSGPTVFGIFSSMTALKQAAGKMPSNYKTWAVCTLPEGAEKPSREA